MGSLEGLGQLNTHETLNISASRINLDKADFNDKRLILDNTKFTSNEQYRGYIKDWLINTGIVNVTETANNSLVASFFDDVNGKQYNVFVSITDEELNNILNSGTCQNIVLFSFNRTSINSKLVEYIGMTEMNEINSAINNGLNKLPFVEIGSNTFKAELAKRLNKKYSAESTTSFIQNEGEQIKQGFNNFGTDAQSVITDGINQLKESFKGLSGLLGGLKGQTQQPIQQPQQMQQTEQFTQQPEQFVQQPIVNNETTVQSKISLAKPVEETPEKINVS
jgi:hypothetical protein